MDLKIPTESPNIQLSNKIGPMPLTAILTEILLGLLALWAEALLLLSGLLLFSSLFCSNPTENTTGPIVLKFGLCIAIYLKLYRPKAWPHWP